MSTGLITITSNDALLRDFFDKIRGRIEDVASVLESIGMELESRVSSRFETQSDPTGSPWHPWAPSTVKRYPEDGNRRILDMYSDMLGSLSHRVDAGEFSVSVGFSTPYAVYHEWGTKHMPRRNMLTVNPNDGTLAPSDVDSVIDIINRHIGL